ncbi:hypothetical protein ACFJI0_21660 [Hydrogenophaga sp. UC242_53]|uniref:hypothetical protein n=1 Tax=Hydrogenophaga sp. UC242_53 TaxID=3350170 RepID=UPI0036D38687
MKTTSSRAMPPYTRRKTPHARWLRRWVRIQGVSVAGNTQARPISTASKRKPSHHTNGAAWAWAMRSACHQASPARDSHSTASMQAMGMSRGRSTARRWVGRGRRGG